MNTFKTLLAAALLVGTTAVANATVFSGTATFSDLTTGNALNVTANPNPKIFSSSNLTAGGSQFFNNFMTLSTTDRDGGLGCFLGCTSTDQIALSFSWTSPGSASSSAGGSVTQTDYLLASFDGGSLVWAGTQNFDIFRSAFYVEQLVTFTNGASAYVDLYDSALTGSGSSQTAQIDMRIRDVRDGATVSAVPEPVTLSIFGAGVIGVGVMRRRRKKAEA